MNKAVNKKVITDDEIKSNMPLGFGSEIDNNVDNQRKQIVKGCLAKLHGYHVGHNLFRTLVSLGLVEDNKKNCETKPTEKGILFLRQEYDISHITEMERLKLIQDRVNTYKYMDKYLNEFFKDVLGKGLNELGMGGIISAHGDKGRGYISHCRKNGVAYPHLMLLLMLSYSPYCQVNFNEVRILDWIVAEYDKLKDKMPPIDLLDEEILK